MMSAETGARMAAETSGGLVKQSFQLTPEQLAWLRARARSRGIASAASVLRELVDEAMRSEAAA